ncbi:copper-binding protein [Motiliproteus sediminis]|uniref:copper-binding protein n=1 Tax=Motiliproteus sediminis TaxID=1468178 RepID=UPI001AEFF134|nr:copper-binding protein [Motiliproteus sediminis]
MFKPVINATALALMIGSTVTLAAGDLTSRPQELPDLVLGNDQSDYAMSHKSYELETGKSYSLKVISSGYKEYAIEAPAFFTSIYLRKVEAGGMEIKATTLTQLEFEEEGEAEVYFVPIKPGDYPFYAAGLEGKGMVGTFRVR